MSGKIESTLRNIMSLFVRKDYMALEKLSKGVRLKASEIKEGITEYGRTLVFPPPEAFPNVDVIPIRVSVPQEYSIRFNFYTVEEGESDLQLQATFIDDPTTEQMRVETNDILVPGDLRVIILRFIAGIMRTGKLREIASHSIHGWHSCLFFCVENQWKLILRHM